MIRLYLVLPLTTYAVPTLLMGFSFTVLQRAVQDDPETSGRKVGLLQAANIAGNVAGSLVVGLLALNLFGTTGSMRALVIGGVVFAFLGIRHYGIRSIFGLAAAALLVLVVLIPGQQDLWNRLHGLVGDEALIEEDASSVVVVKPEDSEWRVVVNGVYHSWLPYGGIHSLLGALPAMMHPSPREVAVIGLGSGDTAWAAASRAETQKLQVYETARPQLNLLSRLAELHGERKLVRFLEDPRLDVSIADGRNALLGSDKLYDLIVVDALRPVSAYSGNLHSLEFLERCALKLKPGGLMSIWAPTTRGRATFARAFPHTVLFDDPRVLVGSNHPIQLDLISWRDHALSSFTRSYLGPSVVQEVATALKSPNPTLKERDFPGYDAELNREFVSTRRISHPPHAPLDSVVVRPACVLARGSLFFTAGGPDFATTNAITNPNRKIFEARKRETAALGAGEKLVLGHPLAATIGDSARCMQNLEKVLFTGPKTSDTVTFICD